MTPAVCRKEGEAPWTPVSTVSVVVEDVEECGGSDDKTGGDAEFAEAAEGGEERDSLKIGGKRKDSPVELDGERAKRRGSMEKLLPETSEREVRRSRRLTAGR